ncbi:E3 ubiquitin-protein ligase At3g02290-like isoform X2 [Macadamia integrifolia]|uniref:E3 ubiquitin-protein ligase At3g02290-like isoform X2 n=1 Tax=Macadamia integrifolia TaxID=60698 RepID=UPI001C4E74C9|nr:E3 ubiquitin-protein ligase At3g02290-like isoform X2 [Macadamia integrifolia]
MGSVCCCLQVEDFEEYVNPNSSVYRNCICLRCFVRNFLNAYTALFRRGEMHAIPSSIQGATSLTSTSSIDNSLSDMYRSPPRPLPCDADPRRFRTQRDGLVSRREKGSSHSHEETEPLRASDTDAEQESLSAGDKWNESDCDGGSKERRSESSLKHSLAKVMGGVGIYYRKPQDNDKMFSPFPPWLYI